jgi:hypothetical protein
MCAIGGHEADQREVYNSGYYFARCRRCAGDMIRTGGAWQAVPRGHRVVWKQGSHRHSIATDYGTHLPVLHPEANLPAVRPAYSSWNRALVRLAGRRIPGGAIPVREDEEPPYPYLLAIAALVGAGLQLLLRGGVGRRRAC